MPQPHKATFSGHSDKWQGASVNQSEFFEANQVNGNLSDAQMMAMLSLPEGDSLKEQVSVPAAEAAPEPKAEPATAETVEPVILAKDGVHTIEYAKLVEAREAEQHWKRVALEAQQLLEAQKAQPQQPVQTSPAEPVAQEADLFGDFSEEAIAKGVEKLVAIKAAAMQAEFDAKLSTALAPLQAKQLESATDEHFNAIAKAHPDVESVAQSEELREWIDAQPSFVRDGYRAVIEQGTAAQVIETLNAFKSATGKLLTAPVKTSAAEAAQAVIAKAQAKPPMSLSEIPAGSVATTDESAAMLDMSSTGLLSKFDGKSSEQIMALMNRVL